MQCHDTHTSSAILMYEFLTYICGQNQDQKDCQPQLNRVNNGYRPTSNMELSTNACMCVFLSKKETLCCLYVYNAIWYLLEYLAHMFYVLTIPNEKTFFLISHTKWKNLWQWSCKTRHNSRGWDWILEFYSFLRNSTLYFLN